ncbi:hypothetical protein Micbo1qcDRAFT_236083 [Microdochium bolleyi]|uniref:WSC domain-containing protein n=1 Tax=Microdochium bolleyi TaxID=196109 RepID=A0A136ISC6_9PEZI|nr:hypothetical protein Micbo1qcDRAFT_236083 [Microdochium bolleyi]
MARKTLGQQGRHGASLAGTILFLLLAPPSAAQDWPVFQWDPETIATCTSWANPTADEKCEDFRKMFAISPEQFHAFNPSVGLDCSGWLKYPGTAYCIADTVRVAQYWATATEPMFTSLRPTTTPSTGTATTAKTLEGTPVPSPLMWKPSDCYETGPDPFANKVLDQQVVKGDKSLTIEACEARCWDLVPSLDGTYAGLRNGDECWCGPRVMREYDPFRSWDGCNATCAGDKKRHCGGKEHMAVYRAIVIHGTGAAWGQVGATTASSTAAPAGVSTAASAGAGAGGGQNGSPRTDSLPNDAP